MKLIIVEMVPFSTVIKLTKLIVAGVVPVATTIKCILLIVAEAVPVRTAIKLIILIVVKVVPVGAIDIKQVALVYGKLIIKIKAALIYVQLIK